MDIALIVIDFCIVFLLDDCFSINTFPIFSRIIKPFSWLLRSGGQEVEFHKIKIQLFHEIKIQLFHEIKIAIMRAKFYLFMRSKLTIIFCQFWSEGRHFDHEIETPKSIITNFDLKIILVTNKLIMRSKLKKHY